MGVWKKLPTWGKTLVVLLVIGLFARITGLRPDDIPTDTLMSSNSLTPAESIKPAPSPNTLVEDVMKAQLNKRFMAVNYDTTTLTFSFEANKPTIWDIETDIKFVMNDLTKRDTAYTKAKVSVYYPMKDAYGTIERQVVYEATLRRDEADKVTNWLQATIPHVFIVEQRHPALAVK